MIQKYLGEPIILESSTKDVEVNEGEEVYLNCKAQGYPRPSISWLRADSKPLYDGKIIHRVFICFLLVYNGL